MKSGFLYKVISRQVHISSSFSAVVKHLKDGSRHRLNLWIKQSDWL